MLCEVGTIGAKSKTVRPVFSVSFPREFPGGLAFPTRKLCAQKNARLIHPAAMKGRRCRAYMARRIVQVHPPAH